VRRDRVIGVFEPAIGWIIAEWAIVLGLSKKIRDGHHTLKKKLVETAFASLRESLIKCSVRGELVEL
jgi:hypothetical protein